MSINNTNCCVFGCHSKKGRDMHLSFHQFPEKHKSFVYITNRLGTREKLDKYKAWMIKLNMGKPATKFMKVCSKHFTRDDFILPGISSEKPRLKINAVPSQNLPEKSFTTVPPGSKRCQRNAVPSQNLPERSFTTAPSESKRCQRNMNTNSDEAEHGIKENILDDQGVRDQQLNLENPLIYEPLKTIENLSVTEQDAIKGLLNLKYTSKKDQQTQVTSGDIMSSFSNMITNDKELNTLTGIPSFALFNAIVVKCEDIFGGFSNKNKLLLRECILLTFMKLKNGFTYAVLAVLFKSITAAACRKIFHRTLIMLSKVLAPIIYWPSKEEIQRNMPICFKNFQKARVVVDCTEIPVQRAKNLKSRLKTYSQYKKGHTIKYMTVVTPGGLIAFSGLLEKMEMFRDDIMVDKGFLIQNMADEYFVGVIQPPFLKKQKQFSKDKALLNKKIAKARVHIERVNQRIKIFEIFKKPLPLSLWPRVDDIFVIACAIVNLTNPVLDDSRFIHNE